MYPGVPLVSLEFYIFQTRAIPKSVTRAYPFLSKMMFSGLISLWRMLLECSEYKASIMQRMRNSDVKTASTGVDFGKFVKMVYIVSEIA